MNIFKKKELKQAESPDEKKTEEDDIDYGNLPLNTAPVANFKKKVAQDLYEPWMDSNDRKKSIDTPPKYPELKSKSKFNFSDDYTKNVSPSLQSIDEKEDKEKQIEKEKEEALARKKAADLKQREALAKELERIEREKKIKTPPPTQENWGSVEKKVNKPRAKSVKRLRHRGVGDGAVSELRETGAGSTLLYPRATSALYDLSPHAPPPLIINQYCPPSLDYLDLFLFALFPPPPPTITTVAFVTEEELIELEEFYAWVTNGTEDDMHPEIIERILFRNRALERNSNQRRRRY